jgi:hypothetical protein
MFGVRRWWIHRRALTRSNYGHELPFRPGNEPLRYGTTCHGGDIIYPFEAGVCKLESSTNVSHGKCRGSVLWWEGDWIEF